MQSKINQTLSFALRIDPQSDGSPSWALLSMIVSIAVEVLIIPGLITTRKVE